MSFADLFRKSEPLIFVDIGSTAIKLIEVDPFTLVPEITNIALEPVNEVIFSNNLISKPDIVAAKISRLLEQNNFGEKRVAITLPGPTVFTKVIRVQKMAAKELAENIEFEAARFLHDSINSVKVDYHVLREVPGNQLEILCIVVKNDILKSFMECLTLAGLDIALVDVDYFSLQNAFELSYPEDIQKTVCLINLGARFSSVNLCQGGNSLYTGSIAVGGNLFTAALSAGLGIPEAEAEKLKRGEPSDYIPPEQVDEILQQKVDAVAADFNRQLGLFWNVSGIQGGIDEIRITGGGCLTPGLIECLAEKTGISCSYLDILRGVTISNKFDNETVKELAPMLGLLAGMSMRQPGDKEIPEFV